MEIVYFIPSSQRRFVSLAAQADTAPTLIYGACGTGKGAIARWIHLHSARAKGPFRVANLHSPLSDQIIEATSGTLVISELGELPLAEQRILLNYLKSRSVMGAQSISSLIQADTRIIGTTSQSLEGRAQGGLFNIELLEKLNVFRIEMPPLAKRSEEFREIVLGLVQEIARELGKPEICSLSEDCWKRLEEYDWPGNLRELRNVLRLAIISSSGPQIKAADLPEFGYTKMDFHATREEFEKIYITELLKTFDWEIDTTCEMTRMDKGTLLAKVKHYGIALTKKAMP